MGLYAARDTHLTLIFITILFLFVFLPIKFHNKHVGNTSRLYFSSEYLFAWREARNHRWILLFASFEHQQNSAQCIFHNRTFRFDKRFVCLQVHTTTPRCFWVKISKNECGHKLSYTHVRHQPYLNKKIHITADFTHTHHAYGWRGAKEWAHFYSLCSEFLLLYSIIALFLCGSSRFLKPCSGGSF